jgi:TRAP-type C4-dicarboxylate transport system permease small subunit
MAHANEGASPQAERWIGLADRLLRLLALLSGMVLVGIAALIVFNVFRRYVLGDALFGTFELIEMGMVMVVFFGLAHCGRSGGHVAVDVFTHVLPRGFWRVTDGLIRLICAAAFFLLAWRGVDEAFDTARYGDTSNLLHIPEAPFWWVVVFGSLLAGLSYLIEGLLSWSGHRDPVGEG